MMTGEPPHSIIAGQVVKKWPQESCPVCAGTGIVCKCCGYGGNRKVPCGRTDPRDCMCEACVPGTAAKVIRQ